MNDKTDNFRELELQAMIVPYQLGWPPAETTIHWAKLHACATEARERVRKTLAAIDKINLDPNLSPEGKAKQRQKVAEVALAEHEASHTLAKARESVDAVMAKWDAPLGKAIKPPADQTEAVLHAQIRDRVSSMSEQRRMAFLQREGGDPTVAAALLLAPQFLSGLSDLELSLIRRKLETTVLTPEVMEAKAATAKAMKEAEHGWQRVPDVIAQRADGKLGASPIPKAKVA